MYVFFFFNSLNIPIFFFFSSSVFAKSSKRNLTPSFLPIFHPNRWIKPTTVWQPVSTSMCMPFSNFNLSYTETALLSYCNSEQGTNGEERLSLFKVRIPFFSFASIQKALNKFRRRDIKYIKFTHHRSSSL